RSSLHCISRRVLAVPWKARITKVWLLRRSRARCACACRKSLPDYRGFASGVAYSAKSCVIWDHTSFPPDILNNGIEPFGQYRRGARDLYCFWEAAHTNRPFVSLAV
ncbi:unnamed protein product, partial [Ectocarpus sp. 12 AP-2014]